MKYLLSLSALALLTGCVTYPEYGYYDNGRGYDSYGSADYYEDGGDYYYGTRTEPYYYDDYSYYGYGAYPYGYGFGLGYGGYGWPHIGFGYSSGYGGYYPYGGYYGGYGGYYGGPYGHHGSHGNNGGHSRGDRWLGARDSAGLRGDGVVDDDASQLADQIARERGVRDATPRSYSSGGSLQRYPESPVRGNYSRERDAGASSAAGGWRSDYREAQLASPRAGMEGGMVAAPRSSMGSREQVQPRADWRQQPRFQAPSSPVQQSRRGWRESPQFSRGDQSQAWSRGRDAQPRSQSLPRQNYTGSRPESAPQRFSAPAPPARTESRSSAGAGNYSRERNVNE